MAGRNGIGTADAHERLRLAIDLVMALGRDAPSDAELESISRVLDEEKRRCLEVFAASPALHGGDDEAMAAFEDPFRCLLLIRALQGIGNIVRIDEVRLVLYAARNLEDLETAPARPARLLASILAGYIRKSAGPDFLKRLPADLQSSEIKPLVRHLIKAGTEEQKAQLRAALEARNGRAADKLADCAIEGAAECLFGAAMVHRVRRQPASIIYYDIVDRCVEFVKDGERRTLSSFLEETTIARAKQLQSLMDDLLFAEYDDSRLLERTWASASYSLQFGGEGDFMNAIDMAYGERPIVYFGGKAPGLLALDSMSMHATRWDLGIEAPIRAIKASASGKLIAVGYEDGSVVVFDASAESIRFREKKVLSSVRRVIFDQEEGGVIAAGNSDDDAIVAIDLATGERSRLRGHGSYVNDLVLATDGRALYSAGHDRLIIKWDLERRSIAAKADAPASIKSLCLSPDGRFLYSGDNRPDGTDRVIYCGILRWNADSLKGEPALVQERAHRDSIRNIRVSESGRYLFSSSLDGQVRIWDAADGRLRFDLPKTEGKSNRSFFLSPDCRYCATGDSAGGISFWNIELLLDDELAEIAEEQLRLVLPYRIDLGKGMPFDIERILGDYHFRGSLIRTYPKMISIVAEGLARESEPRKDPRSMARRLELITSIHETAHAVSMLGGRDLRDRARSWPTGLHETIAQYATWYLLKHDPFGLFRDPGLLEAFEGLLPSQSLRYAIFSILPPGADEARDVLAFFERQKAAYADSAATRAEPESVDAIARRLLDALAKAVSALEARHDGLAAAAAEALLSFRERLAARAGSLDLARLALEIRLWIRDASGLEALIEASLPDCLATETELRFRLVEALIASPESAGSE